MADARKGCLRGCAIGCGMLALVLVISLLVVGVRACIPLQSANRAQAALEERFGPPDAYTPAPDGAIAAERVQAFLEVRRALSAPCRRIAALEGRMRRLERLDEQEPTGGEIVEVTREFAVAASDIAPLIGGYFDRRNRELLGAGMGLGEYDYIFVVAYRERLLDPSFDEHLFSEDGSLAAETQEALRAMLAHQLHAIAAGAPQAGSIEPIERELVAMERDPARLPWQDALPPAIAASLASYRRQLDGVFCSATAGVETDRDARRALKIALY